MALVVIGCDRGTAQVAGTATGPATQAEQVMQSPLATPVATIDWDSQPAPGNAGLRGRIVLTRSTVLLGELFLAKAVPSSVPEIDLLELDEKSSPRALLDRSTGDFLFMDVEPGKYGLIVWEPQASAPVNDPKTGETLFIELAADQVADVGTLFYP